jgi:hypothetical protein
MPTTRWSPAEGTSVINLFLFLISLPRTSKSKEVFKLMSFCRITIMAEAYKYQTGVTQCYNCQQFGHVWANCKQPSPFIWCGGSHLYKECRENGNTASIQTCCNCKLVKGEEAAGTPRKRCEGESRRERPRLQREAVLFQPHQPKTNFRVVATQQHTATTAASVALSCIGLHPSLGAPSQSVRPWPTCPQTVAELNWARVRRTMTFTKITLIFM